MTAPQAIHIADEIASYRPILLRLAMLQLRDKASAEDATQDAMLAAIENQETFEGRAALRTWLISILRFKVLDALRNKKKHGPTISPQQLAEELDLTDCTALFSETGCWATPKDVWHDPQANLEQQEFFRVLDACLTKLPTNTSRVFLMREWLEFSPDEVCTELGVSSGNLRVLLYRARMQLRLCLDNNWERI